MFLFGLIFRIHQVFYGHLNDIISTRTNWKEIYQYIKEESTAKDVAMTFSLEGTLENWGFNGLILSRVYLHKDKREDEKSMGSAYIYEEFKDTEFVQDLRNLISERKNVENIFISLFSLDSDGRIRLIERLKKSGLLVSFFEAPELMTLKIKVMDNDVVKTANILLKDIEYVIINFLNTDTYLLGRFIIYRSLCYLGIELKSFDQVNKYTRILKSKEFEEFFVEDVFVKDLLNFEGFLKQKPNNKHEQTEIL